MKFVKDVMLERNISIIALLLVIMQRIFGSSVSRAAQVHRARELTL